MDKQNVIYAYREILCNYIKEYTTYYILYYIIYYNIDESEKYGVRWQNPDTKAHILYDSIYTVKNRQIHRDGKGISDCQGWERRELLLTAGRYDRFLLGML